MASKLNTHINYSILFLVILFTSCTKIKIEEDERYLFKTDKRLLNIIDRFSIADSSIQNNKVIVLSLVNNRICEVDYYISSANFILPYIYKDATPSKYFERNNRLCIIVDKSDILYQSKKLSDQFRRLIKKHNISVSDATNTNNDTGLVWHIQFKNDSISVRKQGAMNNFDCNDREKVKGLP